MGPASGCVQGMQASWTKTRQAVISCRHDRLAASGGALRVGTVVARGPSSGVFAFEFSPDDLATLL